MEKHDLKIEVKSVPCPKCKDGHLLPFLKPHFKEENKQYFEEANGEFSYYEIYYQCSKCEHKIKGI